LIFANLFSGGIKANQSLGFFDCFGGDYTCNLETNLIDQYTPNQLINLKLKGIPPERRS
jgi:hypothetical protein